MTIVLRRENTQSDMEKQVKFPQHSTEVNPKMHPFPICVVSQNTQSEKGAMHESLFEVSA